MWHRKAKLKAAASPSVEIVMPQAALTCVFDEWDRFDVDETGGRVIGTYEERKGGLVIHVKGIIEPGPAARRSQVSFFQDGAYQEQIFRQIERSHSEIEHLGNWHTHHVNGLPHLSGGDLTTYSRIVNHKKHNTAFFYALLVVAKNVTGNPRERYALKHYLFRRGIGGFLEIPTEHMKIVNEPLIWPAAADGAAIAKSNGPESIVSAARPERVLDRDVLAEFYKEFRPFGSPKLGFYWRGRLELLDGSHPELVLLEDQTASHPRYTIAVRDSAEPLGRAAGDLAKQEFSSARMALITAERMLNRALYQNRAAKR
jgi:integrative and conjugative element protein (TIGR02256 family)